MYLAQARALVHDRNMGTTYGALETISGLIFSLLRRWLRPALQVDPR